MIGTAYISDRRVSQRVKMLDCLSRQLDVVDLDKTVINAGPSQSRKQMFTRRKHHTSPHQGGRVRAMRDILDGRGDLKIIEICSNEYVTGIFRGRP